MVLKDFQNRFLIGKSIDVFEKALLCFLKYKKCGAF